MTTATIFQCRGCAHRIMVGEVGVPADLLCAGCKEPEGPSEVCANGGCETVIGLDPFLYCEVCKAARIPRLLEKAEKAVREGAWTPREARIVLACVRALGLVDATTEAEARRRIEAAAR